MRKGLYKYDIGGPVSADELAAALDAIPAWRREKALSYRRDIDRFLCAKAYLLLREGLEEMFGITGDVEFAFTAVGKPFVKGREDIHFNISHCSRCVCCAISDVPVGVDVELFLYDEEIARRVLNARELETVLSSARPDIEFAKYWAKKESFLKLTGEGIANDLRQVLDSLTPQFEIEVNKLRGYVICVAHDRA